MCNVSARQIYSWVRQAFAACAGPLVIVCTAVLLAGTPDRSSDQPVDSGLAGIPQHTENVPTTSPSNPIRPAIPPQEASAFH